jgi:hypothetical protein
VLGTSGVNDRERERDRKSSLEEELNFSEKKGR